MQAMLSLGSVSPGAGGPCHDGPLCNGWKRHQSVTVVMHHGPAPADFLAITFDKI